MAIAASDKVLIGTDETTGSTIANNATSTSSVTDLLADDASSGEAWLFVKFTGGGTTGTLDIYIDPERTSSTSYNAPATAVSIPPISGTQTLPYGPYPVPRYGQVRATNNGTGGNLTNVFVCLKVFKYS